MIRLTNLTLARGPKRLLEGASLTLASAFRQQGVVDKNTASRKVSRLTHRIAALGK